MIFLYSLLSCCRIRGINKFYTSCDFFFNFFKTIFFFVELTGEICDAQNYFLLRCFSYLNFFLSVLYLDGNFSFVFYTLFKSKKERNRIFNTLQKTCDVYKRSLQWFSMGFSCFAFDLKKKKNFSFSFLLFLFKFHGIFPFLVGFALLELLFLLSLLFSILC